MLLLNYTIFTFVCETRVYCFDVHVGVISISQHNNLVYSEPLSHRHARSCTHRQEKTSVDETTLTFVGKSIFSMNITVFTPTRVSPLLFPTVLRSTRRGRYRLLNARSALGLHWSRMESTSSKEDEEKSCPYSNLRRWL